MKCSIKSKRLYFDEFTTVEYEDLEKVLIWTSEDPDGNTVVDSNLILYDDLLNKHYTHWGIYNLFKKYNIFDIELTSHEVVRDNEVVPNIPKDILPNIEFLKFQLNAIQKCIRLKTGFIEIPTGGGKTEVMLGLLRWLINNGRIKSAIIVVPSVGLADQFEDRAVKRGFTKEEVGVIHGDRKEYDSIIKICVINSLNMGIKNNNKKIIDIVEETDFLAYDEGHHLQAESWTNLSLACLNAKYLLCFSGSAFDDPEDILAGSGDVLIQGLTGGTIFQVSYTYLREIGLIATPIIYFKKIGATPSRRPGRYNNIYNSYIVNHDKRNESIKEYTNLFAQCGFPVLIIIKRLDHAEKIMKRLRNLKCIAVFGSGRGLQNNELGQIEECPINYNSFRSNFESGAWDVALISSVGDEGFDMPAIGAVIIAGGEKSRKKLLQRIGRGLRKKRIGPNRVYILDFDDSTHVYMKSHSKRRIKLCEYIQSPPLEQEFEFKNLIYEHSVIISDYKRKIGRTFLESVREGSWSPWDSEKFLRMKSKTDSSVKPWEWLGINENQYKVYERDKDYILKIIDGEA